MAKQLEIRDFIIEDRDWLYALNEASLPAVNKLSMEGLCALIEKTAHTRIAVLNGTPVGAAMLLTPGIEYDSLNYQWFQKRMENFLYLDRIMVERDARGAGIGKALCQDVFSIAEADSATNRVLCEVNLKPFNGGSLKFHARLGFAVVGEQETEGGYKSVVLLSRIL
jgi:predicted GNAT superfamily acetyltransferase